MTIFKHAGALIKAGGEDIVDTANYALLVDSVQNYTSVTSTPYTTLESDTFITANVSSGTINLISTATVGKKWYAIYNKHATSLTLDGSGAQTVLGAATKALAQGEMAFIYVDGTNWAGGVLGASGGGGETNLAANVGTGAGLIWRDKTGVTLNFKRIAAGTGMTVTNGADDITLSSTIAGNTVVTIDAAGGGNYTTLSAALAAEGDSKKYLVAAGTYEFSNLANTTADNIHVDGAGMGATIFQVPASATTTEWLMSFAGSTGTEHTISSTVVGDLKITVPTEADFDSYALGDYVLVSDDSEVDSDNDARNPGEIHQVVLVDDTNNFLFLDTPIRYAYSTSPQVAKITFRNNITFKNITFKSAQTASSLSSGSGQVIMKYVKNLSFENCEFDNMWVAGLQLIGCLDTRVTNCYIHETRDSSASGTTEYGISVRGATLAAVISNSIFYKLRHAITTGAGGPSGEKGRPEYLKIDSCLSRYATEAHFDTHRGCGEGIVFSNCYAVGDDTIGATLGAAGFSLRSKAQINNCVAGYCTKGLALFPGASNANGTDSGANGTKIRGFTAHDIMYDGVGNNTGHGVFASDGVDNISIDGLECFRCEGSAISLQTGSGLTGDWIVKNVLADVTNTTAAAGTHTIAVSGSNHVFTNMSLKNNAGAGFPISVSSNVTDLTLKNTTMSNNTNNVASINADATFKQFAKVGTEDVRGKTITATYTADAGDSIIYMGAGTYTITVDATKRAGQILHLRRTSATGTVTIDPSGAQTIDGVGTSKTSTTGVDTDALVIQSNGTNWYKIGGNL